MAAGRFDKGQHILLREVWRGRVWTARPVTVVEDSRELIALHIAKGAVWKRPFDPAGMPKRIPAGDWILNDEFWTTDVLRLSIPAARFSILPFRGLDTELRVWYLNVETPLIRKPFGFEYMDQTLDIVVSPDLTHWRWKDEDELAEAVSLGLYTPEDAADIRSAGERAVDFFLARKPPFDRDWENWRPAPDMEPPQLRPGWDLVE